MAKEKKTTVKCKGCGNEVWIGSKLHDGYCHDCYSRGRHLPPDTEDWLKPAPKKKPTKKKPAPATQPHAKPARKKTDWRLLGRVVKNIFRRYRWRAVLACLIVVGVVFGIYAAVTYFNRPMTEAGTIDRLRSEKYSTFINLGERIPDDDIPANAEAITAYIDSGESYRTKGIFEYAFYDYMNDYGREKKARSDIEMSYNKELDVYQFKITNNGDSVDTLEQYRIAEGTYYIIKENGKTYVLYHGGGKRIATDINEDRKVYDFLLQYCMSSLIKTDYFTDISTAKWHLWDGDMYALSHSDVGSGKTVYDGRHRTELRTYKNKPLVWFDCNRDAEAMVEWQIKVDFYYDNIPKDAPSVADYR